MKLFSLLAATISLSLALEIGQVPETIILEGENGGTTKGEAFSSESLKDKVHVLFYVDPDEKDLNEHVVTALKEQAFDREKYASVAIINMAATWLPNFAIASKLKAKQKEHPHTLHVKDLQSVLVKKWDLRDDSSNIVLFAKDRKVLFVKKGKLSEEEVHTLISTIKENL